MYYTDYSRDEKNKMGTPEKESCQSEMPMALNHPLATTKRNSGDIEAQFNSLSVHAGELEKIFAELLIKIEPILSPEQKCVSGEKDCNKEEALSPMANGVRRINNSLSSLKYRIGDTIRRIQL